MAHMVCLLSVTSLFSVHLRYEPPPAHSRASLLGHRQIVNHNH